jgi:hypothetical protein
VSRLELLDPTKTGKQAEALENQLRHFVVGQEEAIHAIVRAYRASLAGLSPVGRPIGNFIFLGADGVRKNSHRGGNRRVPAEGSSSSSQDRLRGVSTPP